MLDSRNETERKILDDVGKEIRAFLGNIIDIADYYNYNRDKLLNDCSIIILTAVGMATFKDYDTNQEMIK